MSDDIESPGELPSGPPPRGPSLWKVGILLAVLVGGVWIGSAWGGEIASGLKRLWGSATGTGEGSGESAGVRYYTCGMHPWVVLPKPGDCPICHMKLIPLDPSKFTGTITIDPVVVQNIGVRIGPVTTGPLVRTIRTVGTVDYDETRVRDITVKVSGWIEKLKVDYLGAPVRKGDELFAFYSPELYAAQEEYLLAAKNAGQVGADFVPQAAQSARDLAQAARTRLLYFDITSEQIDALRKAGQPAKTMVIRSPYDGVVIDKHANEGMRVDQGMRLYRLADLSKVWAMVTLYEYQLPYVSLGQQAAMTLPYIPGRQWNGKVIYIYPYLSEKTREVKVRLEFDNPDMALKPGMFANVVLSSRLADDRVLAPRSAIIDTGERQVAFVSLGGGQFEPRDVTMGVQAGDGMVEVLDGLHPGEMVVTSGQFLLDSESKIREALARMVRGEQAAEQRPTAAVPALPGSELDVLPPAAADALNQALRSYFAIADKLAADSAEGVGPPARELADAAARLVKIDIPGRPHFWHQHPELAAVGGRARELADAKDIVQARLKLADLSVALGKLLTATGVPPSFGQEVQQLHCPMFMEDQGGSIWLQPAGPVRNPFYGARMPECFDRRTALPMTGQAGPAAPTTQPGGAGPPAASQPAERRTTAIDPASQQAIDRLVSAYLRLTELLARDEFKGADREIGAIHESADVLAGKGPKDLGELAGRIGRWAGQSYADLPALRLALKELSNAVIELVKSQTPPSRAVGLALYQVHCPMTKGDWLQTGRTVANPYYGKEMLTCGSIVATFGSSPPATQPEAPRPPHAEGAP